MRRLPLPAGLLAALLLPALAAAPAAAAVYSPGAPLSFGAFVAANTSAFTNPETAPGSSAYSVPGLLAKPSLGLALSGGGLRAAALGIGWLRGLVAANATRSARYLTSNSGGSWLNAAWSFQRAVPQETFLGPYVPPQQLDWRALTANDSVRGSFEAAVADAGLLLPGALSALAQTAVTLTGQQQLGIGAWSATIGRIFLEPWGLNADDSTFTASGTAGPVHQAALASLPPSVAVYRYNGSDPERPFPIMLGAILRQETQLGFYPTEFTPLYAGCPPWFADTDPALGGGFVDPQGLNSPPPVPAPTLPAAALAATAASAANASANASAANASGTASNSSLAAQLLAAQPLNVTAKPTYLVPLKVVAGISSSFLTNLFKPNGSLSRELTGTEVLWYWNQADFRGLLTPFADGGSADNLAITPLLRRRVTHIVACVAAVKNVSGTTPEDWAGYQWDVSGLFGAAPQRHPSYDKGDGTVTGIPSQLLNKKLQVFPTSAYAHLFEALQNTTATGGPTFHLATYNVLSNQYQAIFGGWQVTVLWVVNQQLTLWEAALPADTQDVLHATRQQKDASGLRGVVQDVGQAIAGAVGAGNADKSLEDFPFTPTSRANFSPQLTKMLGQQAAWQMTQLRPQLQQLMQQAAAGA